MCNRGKENKLFLEQVKDYLNNFENRTHSRTPTIHSTEYRSVIRSARLHQPFFQCYTHCYVIINVRNLTHTETFAFIGI